MEGPDRRTVIRAAIAVLGPAAATGVGLVIGEVRTTAAALAYILAVLAVAAVGGLVPGIVASVLSFLGLNYFFTPTRRTFSVAKSDDLIALAVFLSVGVVVSGLVALERSQRLRAERRELESRTLHAISSRLLGDGDLNDALAELAGTLRRLLGLARSEVRVDDPRGEPLVVVDGESAGGSVVRVPLTGARGDLGELILEPGTTPIGEAEHRVASIFARQTAAAIERRDLEHEAREARLTVETNRLRRAILSAVSHDFRTPLASIKAAITALMSARDAPEPLALEKEESGELLSTALEETERLERLVANLLDLTRIRSGAIAPERSRVVLDDLIEDVMAGLRNTLGDHRVTTGIRPGLPPLDVDPVQIGQVLGNVLENAAKFTPAGSEIRLNASAWHGSVELRVIDRGPGIEEAAREKVFDEFYRAGDGRAAGTGLGLAVAKALVRANGGDIWIEGTAGGGTTVAIRLPAAVGARA
jgi:two-component system, OmpR family, sensor histidine kinase KdpD